MSRASARGKKLEDPMADPFRSMPKSWQGKPLTAYGSKHPEFRLALEAAANRQEDPDLFLVSGTWAWRKIAERGIRVDLFLFDPEAKRGSEELAAVAGFVGLADKAGYVSAALCARLSDRDDPEGAFALCRLPGRKLSDFAPSPESLVLVLDALEKPGNVGTIVRTAEAAGAEAVLHVDSPVRLTHRRVVAASLGSVLTLPVYPVGRTHCMEWLRERGYTAYLTELDGEKEYFAPGLYEGRVAIVAGNEIRGVSPEWRAPSANRPPVVGVRIPMAGDCDSLNVGFAETLVAYEAGLRKRGLMKR